MPNKPNKTPPKVALIMGSKSDWPTMEAAAHLLSHFKIPYHAEVVSAHRTPDKLASFAKTAEANGFQCIIAGAGGAAHLPGMVAAHTLLPVIGVPIQSKALQGLDSLLSIVQMPAGIPVATVAIGTAGAKNAAILAAQIIALHCESTQQAIKAFREQQTSDVLNDPNPEQAA